MNRQSAGNNQELIQIFKQHNESILDTAKYFNVSYSTMWARLKQAGIKSKKKKPVYSDTLIIDYFREINTPSKAYFAGFIKADGYVDRKRFRLAIRIQEKDVDILKMFCDCVNLPIKRINIIKAKNNQHVEVAITNKLFVTPLLNIKEESFLEKIPENLSYDFIRGYFDGDGCINYRNIQKKSFQMNIMGSPSDSHMLEYILKYFPDFGVYNDKRSDLPFLKTANLNLILKFRELIYNNCYIYLARKKEKFDRIKLWLEPQRSHVKHPVN